MTKSSIFLIREAVDYQYNVVTSVLYTPHGVFHCFERLFLIDGIFQPKLPQGEYQFEIDRRYKDGRIILWNDRIDKNRGFQMHIANFPRDLRGCIGIGLEAVEKGDQFVRHSAAALTKFSSILKRGHIYSFSIDDPVSGMYLTPQASKPLKLQGGRLDASFLAAYNAGEQQKGKDINV